MPSHYEATATDHLADTLDTYTRVGGSSAAMRSIMVADVYARLEVARQLGRIADAIDTLSQESRPE